MILTLNLIIINILVTRFYLLIAWVTAENTKLTIPIRKVKITIVAFIIICVS